MNVLFRSKSIESLRADAERSASPLRRTLGTFDLTMFGIGAILGAGILSSIGTAAAGNVLDGRMPAGPALVFSILLVAVGCCCTALAYAELASMIPVSGSAYSYAYATMGEAMAWVIGWDLLLEYTVSNVTVAISWGSYAGSFLASAFHVRLPGWLAMDPRTALTLADEVPAMGIQGKLDALAGARGGFLDGGATFLNWEVLRDAPTLAGFPITLNLPPMLITCLVTWLAYLGIKESSRVNAVMVVLKVVLLLVVAGIGLRFVDPGNWVPFVPYGFKGIQAGAAIIFFAFIGFDAVSTTAEECRDPGRDLPRGILLSLVLCTVIYVAVALVVTGMMPYAELAGKADALAYIFVQGGHGGLAGVVSLGAVIATTSALMVYQIAQPRIFLAMSRDGLLGKWIGKVSPKHGTPSNATVFTGLLVAAPAALLNIDEVVELTNIGTLFAFAVVCTAVMVLRLSRPELPRRFRMPWVWVLAPGGILSCAWVAWGLPSLTWIRFLGWLVLGMGVYLAYGCRHSLLRRAGGLTPGNPRSP